MRADNELLQQYLHNGSEAAFAELVGRHLKMVYSAALRQVNGDTHLAQDIAQSVFTDLARQAKKLTGRASITGWLYTSARFAAAKAVRSEARRRTRENAMAAMNQITSSAHDAWNELPGLIDDALHELAEKDREAVVLRYFESSEFAVIGAALGLTENAARMRVERALEKLRAILKKRGLNTTGAALASALAEANSAALPSGLGASIAASALKGISPSLFQWIIMSKLKTAALAVALSFVAILLLCHRSSVSPQSIAPQVSSAPARAHASSSPPVRDFAFRGDPDAVRKIAQRHNEQVHVPKKDWLTEQLTDELGKKKFGVRIQTRLAPGESLVTGGWSTGAGKRLVLVLTPIPQPDNSGTLKWTCNFFNVPENSLADNGLQTFQNDEKQNNLSENVPSDVTKSLLKTLLQASGLSSTIEFVVPLGASSITGGPDKANKVSLNQTASLATDGASLDVGVMACYEMPDSP